MNGRGLCGGCIITLYRHLPLIAPQEEGEEEEEEVQLCLSTSDTVYICSSPAASPPHWSVFLIIKYQTSYGRITASALVVIKDHCLCT
ncbi:hypothetical protein SKAU_G00305400 [Synaphobranchus kaupii]|uniref:Uncharacterized protein n=1 Tax=Synaphobranchus kaupii TaxID=118154 RepID=A0A9Q1IJS9_SYNKA|nr:hypothetical protein SKAU_G00305400 [Synaphobranchus kaupii]